MTGIRTRPGRSGRSEHSDTLTAGDISIVFGPHINCDQYEVPINYFVTVPTYLTSTSSGFLTIK